MALRVLLADESTTIKKVMQLALQDFAVEVKAVHSGVDVLEVARQFQPDLIFADILLQKKNGYEVAADLKQDPQLSSIPVVLMWSSFMDLDETLASQSRADSRLEKPFDVENLRQVVLNLVPRTHSQRLAHFLKFPENVTQPLKEEVKAKAAAPAATAPVKPTSAPQASRPVPPPPPAPSPRLRSETDPTIPIAPPNASSPAAKPGARPAVQQAQKTPPPAPPTPPSANWNMESFDSISSFEAEETNDDNFAGDLNSGALSAPEIAVAAAKSVDDSVDDSTGDEGYSEFKLTNLSSRRTKAPAPSLESAAGDDSEPWSHQDLSRFKVDLPPVAVEGEEFELTVDPSEHDVDGTGFKTEPLHRRSSLGIEPFEIDNAPEELDLPQYELDDTEPLELKSNPRMPEPNSPRQPMALASGDELSLDGGPIPQLTPDRLEQIVRAQSREIIESVVRRIVPDIASELIRQELNRLLEDSGLHETSERGTRR